MLTKKKTIRLKKKSVAEKFSYFQRCLTKDKRNWLYARGFSDRTIDDVRIGYDPATDTITLGYLNVEENV